MACTVLLCSYRCNIFCSIYISDFTHEWSSYAILTSFLTHIRRVTKVRQKQQELFILLFGHFLSSLSFPHRSILPFYSPFLFYFFYIGLSLAGTEMACPPNQSQNGNNENTWMSLKVDVCKLHWVEQIENNTSWCSQES